MRAAEEDEVGRDMITDQDTLLAGKPSIYKRVCVGEML